MQRAQEVERKKNAAQKTTTHTKQNKIEKKAHAKKRKGREKCEYMFLWYANNVQRQKNTDMFSTFLSVALFPFLLCAYVNDAHKIRARTFNILRFAHKMLRKMHIATGPEKEHHNDTAESNSTSIHTN